MSLKSPSNSPRLVQLVNSTVNSTGRFIYSFIDSSIDEGVSKDCAGFCNQIRWHSNGRHRKPPRNLVAEPNRRGRSPYKVGLQNPMPQVAKSNRDGRSRHPFGVAEPNKDGKKLCKIRVAEPGMSCRTPFIELQNPIEVAEPNKDGRTPCHGVQGCGTRYKMKLAKAAIDLELPNPTRASKKGNPSTCAPSCRTRSG